MTESARPVVTVVVASYNHRQYLQQAVQSIVSQNYRPLDVLVVDDGSTDGSGELLETLAEQYGFRLIRRENGGLVSVVNLAIREARGEYFFLQATDDASLPGRILRQVDVLERHPKVAFVSGNVAFVSEDGSNRGTLLTNTGAEREFGFDELFVHRVAASSVGTMYRTSVLREMGALSTKYRAEDRQMFLRITRLGHTWIQWAGDPVVAYRMLPTSQSRTAMPLLLRDEIRLVDEYSDHPLHREAAAVVRTALISALAESDKRAALRELLSGNLKVASAAFVRLLVKLAIPQKWHSYFKRDGAGR